MIAKQNKKLCCITKNKNFLGGAAIFQYFHLRMLYVLGLHFVMDMINFLCLPVIFQFLSTKLKKKTSKKNYAGFQQWRVVSKLR